MKPGYVVAQLRIHDEPTFSNYARLAAKTVVDHGGEFLIGTKGRCSHVEGSEDKSSFVVVKFPSYERLENWYRSSEYSELIKMRQQAATGSVTLYEGL